MPDWLLSIFSSVVAGSIVVFLGRIWIQSRLIASIRHEYDRQLEVYKRELDKKYKVDLLAELFAEWTAVPRGEPIPKERRARINQLSFAAALWLPTEVMVEMAKTLQLRPGAKTYFEVLLMARKHLTGDDTLRTEDITVWGPGLEKRGEPVIHI